MKRLLELETVDTNRLKLLLDLGQLLKNSDPGKTYNYGVEAFAIAKKENLHRQMAEASYLIADAANLTGKTSECIKFANKSHSIYLQLQDTIGVIRCLNMKSVYYMGLSDFSKAVQLLNTAVDYALKTDYFEGLAVLYNNLGLIYDDIDDFSKAFEMYHEAMHFDSVAGNFEGIGYGLNNIGRLYAKKGEIDKCVEYYLKSYQVFENSKNETAKSIIQNNIGEAYFDTKNYDKAREHFWQAVYLKKKLGNAESVANTYMNLGKLYAYGSNIDSMLYYYNKADSLYVLAGNKSGVAQVYSEYAKYFISENNLKKARFYLNKSIKERGEISDIDGIAECYLLMAKLLYSEGALNQAETWVVKAVEKAQETQNKKLLADCYFQSSEIFESGNKYRKAHDFLKKYLSIYKEINDEKIKKTTAELQTKYEVSIKDEEITALNIENQNKKVLLQKEQERNRLVLILFILTGLVLVFSTVFTILLYKQFKQKKRANKKLAEQKEYILKQRDLITEELNQTIVKAEKLKIQNMHFQLEALKNQLNPHFLFNTFSTLINLIPENAKVAEKYTRSLSQVYRYILSDNDTGLAVIEKELGFVHNYMFLVAIRFNENVQLVVSVPEDDKDKKIPMLSLQLLVENAVKHNIISSKKPLLINIETSDGFLTIRNNLQKKNMVIHSTKTGLENIKKRYQLLSKNNTVEIQETRKEFIVKLPML